LTIKALRTLEQADVVLFDDLVSAEILELTRRTARRLHVGKRGYRGGCAQARIHALMLRFARHGRHVVRLKAGDPLIFGRAGEELAALRAAGIEVEVVPGITAATALGAATLSSLTHRDHAHALTLITGHGCDHRLPAELARAGQSSATLVVYMGAAQALAIARELIEGGRDGSTPAVMMAAVSRPQQVLWTGQLHDLATGAAALGTAQPVVIGVGEVFRQAWAAQPVLLPAVNSA